MFDSSYNRGGAKMFYVKVTQNTEKLKIIGGKNEPKRHNFYSTPDFSCCA